jgi:hypothetical protein
MILPFDEDLTKVFKPHTPSHTHFYGLEIEIDHRELSEEYESPCEELEIILNDHSEKLIAELPVKAVAKFDGSVRTAGFEVVTAPFTLDRYIGKLAPFTTRASALGYTSWESGRCGLHIHVNKNSLTQFQISKILSMVYNPINFKFIKMLAQRHNERYANFSNPEYGKPRRAKLDRNYSRYTAINLENRHTLEFRLFRGSLNTDTIYKNLEFVDALLHFTKSCSHSYNECSDWICFYRFIKANYKKYPNLYKFIVNQVESIRKNFEEAGQTVLPDWVRQIGIEDKNIIDKSNKRSMLKA